MKTRQAQSTNEGLTVKVYGGDRSALLSFDLEPHLTQNFTGFAVKVTTPSGQSAYLPNRLSYDQGLYKHSSAQQGTYTPSNEAPFQRFRWFHSPVEVEPGDYRYEVTAMYLRPGQDKPEPGSSTYVDIDIVPDPSSMQLGFTRGYMSSQVYSEKWGKDLAFGPTPKSLDYDSEAYQEKYTWLGFHARKLVVGFAAAGPSGCDAPERYGALVSALL